MFESQFNGFCHSLVNKQPGNMRPACLAMAGTLLQFIFANPDPQPVQLCKNPGIPCFSPVLQEPEPVVETAVLRVETVAEDMH